MKMSKAHVCHEQTKTFPIFMVDSKSLLILLILYKKSMFNTSLPFTIIGTTSSVE